jgi:hypothetical protein
LWPVAIDITIAWSIVTQPARCNGAPQPRAGCPAPDRIGCGDFFNLRVGARSKAPRSLPYVGLLFDASGAFRPVLANFLPGAQPRLDPGARPKTPLRRTRPLALRSRETAWGL